MAGDFIPDPDSTSSPITTGARLTCCDPSLPGKGIDSLPTLTTDYSRSSGTSGSSASPTPPPPSPPLLLLTISTMMGDAVHLVPFERS